MRSCARTRILRAAVPFCLTVAAVAGQSPPPARRPWIGAGTGSSKTWAVQREYYPTAPPANGPSQLPRHAVSADGRYVLFTSEASNIGYYSGYGVYLRDRRTYETRLLLGGPALDPVLSADGHHIAFQLCDPTPGPEVRTERATSTPSICAPGCGRT